MTSIRLIMKKDKYCARLKSKLDKGVFNIPTIDYTQELMNLHATRRVRSLTVKAVVARHKNALIKARLQNQAYRSRVVEIMLICHEASAKLSENIDTLRKYLRARYGNDLKETYKTAGERTDAIEYALSEAITRRNRIDTVYEMAETLIEDFVAAAWSLKATEDVMNATSRSAPEI